jgi:hypothetical protein
MLETVGKLLAAYQKAISRIDSPKRKLKHRKKIYPGQAETGRYRSFDLDSKF